MLALLMIVVGMVSGYVGAIVIAGYILFCESDTFLRRTAIKTLIVMCLVSLGATAANLLPRAIGFVSNFLNLFGGSLYIGFLDNLCSWIASAFNLSETVVLALMAINALKGKDFKIGFIDKLVDGTEEAVGGYTQQYQQPQQTQQDSNDSDPTSWLG
jgi:hypothetical protein